MVYYYITTIENDYLNISGVKRFRELRARWNDNSPIIGAMKWNSKKEEWTPADKNKFKQEEGAQE